MRECASVKKCTFVFYITATSTMQDAPAPEQKPGRCTLIRIRFYFASPA